MGCGPTRSVLSRPTDSLLPPELPKPETAKPAPEPVVIPVSSEDAPAKPSVEVERRPKNILALSGGGQFGAFTAGVLGGWTRTNDRPEFDVVTGISTGALMAPLAFLGPKYDADMRAAYTEVRQKDVFALRSVATIPFRDAVASSAPLRRMVESAITEEVVASIAVEHKKGRRLYVGTTQLDSKRTVVWDLGAIASSNTKDTRRTICDIMVASCSVPGVFPPVPITVEVDGKPRTEMHVDGGATTSIFIPPQVFEAARADRPGVPPANLYAIVAGKYYNDPEPVRPRLIRVVKASGIALLRSQTRRDLANLYLMSKLSGVKYHSIALRQEFPTEDVGLEFDQALMNKLYVEGVKVGVEGPKWDTSPPERGPGEMDDIRTSPTIRSRPDRPE